MRARCLLCALLCLFTLALPAGAVSTSAASAILVDADSGRVLYAHAAQERRLIASITKLMTALVAAEVSPDLQEVVTIKAAWTGAEGSSIYLKPGEKVRLETLLYGLLLQSGNDAALAVAGHCAGDVDTFVDWMNQKAAALGMENTHFANPNGLNHEAHYSTAADMATLAAACLQNAAIAAITATRSIHLEGRTFVNHNKLLWQYPDCVGMKTGYTQLAGRTLISAARREGQTLVAVTLSDPNDWEDHKALLDYGFAAYPRRVLCQAGEEVGHLRVGGSLVPSVAVVTDTEAAYPLTPEEQVEREVRLPQGVEAPVTAGEVAGELVFTCNGREIGRSYLLYAQDVRRDTVPASRGIRRMLDIFRARRTGGVEAMIAQCAAPTAFTFY